jgi:hypothetical protein
MEVVGDGPLANKGVDYLKDGMLNGGCRVEMMSDGNRVVEGQDIVERVRPLKPRHTILLLWTKVRK